MASTTPADRYTSTEAVWADAEKMSGFSPEQATAWDGPTVVVHPGKSRLIMGGFGAAMALFLAASTVAMFPSVGAIVAAVLTGICGWAAWSHIRPTPQAWTFSSTEITVTDQRGRTRRFPTNAIRWVLLDTEFLYKHQIPYIKLIDKNGVLLHKESVQYFNRRRLAEAASSVGLDATVQDLRGLNMATYGPSAQTTTVFSSRRARALAGAALRIALMPAAVLAVVLVFAAFGQDADDMGAAPVLAMIPYGIWTLSSMRHLGGLAVSSAAVELHAGKRGKSLRIPTVSIGAVTVTGRLFMTTVTVYDRAGARLGRQQMYGADRAALRAALQPIQHPHPLNETASAAPGTSGHRVAAAASDGFGRERPALWLAIVVPVGLVTILGLLAVSCTNGTGTASTDTASVTTAAPATPEPTVTALPPSTAVTVGDHLFDLVPSVRDGAGVGTARKVEEGVHSSGVTLASAYIDLHDPENWRNLEVAFDPIFTAAGFTKREARTVEVAEGSSISAVYELGPVRCDVTYNSALGATYIVSCGRA